MSVRGSDDIKSGKRFFSGVMALALSTVLVKVIGLLYKIPMMQYLGAEGMGYFNSAYEIYTLFFIISTAGLPVAISIIISENKAAGRHKNVSRIFKTSLVLLGVVGALGAALMGMFPNGMAALIHNEGARMSIMAISPTLLFICISSAIRGYFQGNQIMFPTAVSQVIEALGKLGLGLVFAVIAINNGHDMPTVAAYAVLGITVGVAISMLFLIICKLIYKPRVDPDNLSCETQTPSSILKELLVIAIPITLSATAMSLTRIIDMGMILWRLWGIGYSEEMANAAYGAYSTMASSIYNLPAAFVSAISVPLVPMLTAALEKKDKIKEKKVAASSIKLTALIAFPCSIGIAVFSKQILTLLFSSQTKEIEYVAPLLSILGISVFLSCMITLTNAILQAYKMVNKPIISIVCGSLVKVISSYIMIGIPEINIYGAPISTFLSVLTIVSVNVYFIIKKIGRLDKVLTLFGRPFLSAFLSVAFGVAAFILLELISGSRWNIAITIMLIALLYLVLTMKLRVLDEEDILMLPMGEKLASGLKKIKLL